MSANDRNSETNSLISVRIPEQASPSLSFTSFKLVHFLLTRALRVPGGRDWKLDGTLKMAEGDD